MLLRTTVLSLPVAAAQDDSFVILNGRVMDPEIHFDAIPSTCPSPP
jgi:hypothetical protein